MGKFSKLKTIKQYLFGKYNFKKNTVNLLYWDNENFGDQLSPVIVDFMLKRKGLSFNSPTKKKYTVLSSLGSIFFISPFVKKTMWGTGSFKSNVYDKNARKLARLDVRCIRGPLTEELLLDSKILKKRINSYGDPGILMPLIYPGKSEKKYKISVVPHMSEEISTKYHIIDVRTKDWKKVIDEITQSEFIISSSLHGIIIAEAYGIPAVWLHNEESSQKEFKYLDYYYSTGRKTPNIAKTINEAIMLRPSIPDIKGLQENLIRTFPYDLWK